MQGEPVLVMLVEDKDDHAELVTRQMADHHIANKLAKSSKFLSPPQADGVLRNFAPAGTDFAKAWNPRSKLRGI